MVELVQGSPFTEALNEGNRSRAAIAASEENRRVAEDQRLNAEVAQRQADNLDRNIATAMAPSNLRNVNAAPPVPSPVPVPQPANGGIMPVSYSSPPPLPQPVNQAAPPSVPSARPTATSAVSHGDLAGVYLDSPGYRARGAQMSIDATTAAQAQEARVTDRFIDLASSNPGMAVAFANQNGIDIPPMFQRALGSQWVRDELKRFGDEARIIYKDDPAGYLKAMGQRTREIAQQVKSVGARQSNAGGVQQTSTGAGQPQDLSIPQLPDYANMPVPSPMGKPQRGFIVKGESGYVYYDPNTQTTSPLTVDEQPVIPATSGSGGKKTVFELKRDAWLAIHPDDSQGALEYASGRRTMPPEALRKSAMAEARSQLEDERAANYDYTPLTQQEIEQRANQIYGYYTQGEARQVSPPPAQQMQTAPDGNQYPSVTTQAEYDALPPGSIYYHSGQQKFLTKG